MWLKDGKGRVTLSSTHFSRVKLNLSPSGQRNFVSFLLTAADLQSVEFCTHDHLAGQNICPAGQGFPDGVTEWFPVIFQLYNALKEHFLALGIHVAVSGQYASPSVQFSPQGVLVVLIDTCESRVQEWLQLKLSGQKLVLAVAQVWFIRLHGYSFPWRLTRLGKLLGQSWITEHHLCSVLQSSNSWIVSRHGFYNRKIMHVLVKCLETIDN